VYSGNFKRLKLFQEEEEKKRRKKEKKEKEEKKKESPTSKGKQEKLKRLTTWMLSVVGQWAR
jgi:hypothetical protein